MAEETATPTQETAAEAKPFSVELTELENNVQRIAVTVDKEKVDETLAKEYREIRKSGLVPGFRKGKAPLKLIESRYSAQIRPRVMQDLFQELLPDVFDDIDIDPLGMPEIDGKLDINDEGQFTFAIQVECQPSFDPIGYKNVEVEVEKVDLDEVLKDFKDRLAREHATYTALPDTPLEEGHFFKIVLDGKLDDELLGEDGIEEIQGIYGETKFLPGTPISTELEGRKQGDTFTVDFRFPDDYDIEALRGKHLEGLIRVLEVKEVVKPELNDQFVKETLNQDKTWDEYWAEQQAEIEKNIKDRRYKEVTDKVTTSALEANPINLSDAIVEAELQQRQDYYSLSEELKDYLRAMARRRLSSEILFKNIVRHEELEATDEEVDEAIRKEAEQAGRDFDELKEEVIKRKQLHDFKNQVLQEKALDLMFREATVKEVDELSPDAPAEAETTADDDE